jgi:hypothetical protein
MRGNPRLEKVRSNTHYDETVINRGRLPADSGARTREAAGRRFAVAKRRLGSGLLEEHSARRFCTARLRQRQGEKTCLNGFSS